MDLPSYGLTAETPGRVGHAAFYQQFVRSLINATRNEERLWELGSQLVAAAEHAHDLEQTETVRSVSRLFLETPLVERYEAVGIYCNALASDIAGDNGEVIGVIGGVFDRLPVRLKSKALLTLSRGYGRSGDFRTFFGLTVEAIRMASKGDSANLRSFVSAQRNLAICSAMSGDHSVALHLLQSSLPLAEAVGKLHPYIYFEHLNSVAVELMELGRVREAWSAISLSLASPIAATQPNWHETARDIALKLRPASKPMVTSPGACFAAPEAQTPVAENSIARPAITLPTLSQAQRAPLQLNPAPARILDFQKWKSEAVLSRPRTLTRLTETQRRLMPTGGKLIRIMDLLSRDETDDNTIDRALVKVEDVVFGEDTPEL